MADVKPSAVEKPYVIEEIIEETPDVYRIRMKSQDGSKLAFEPGMFVMLEYVNPQTYEKISRAYSIASAPNSDKLEFFIHMMHGALTSHLEDAKVGDVYYVTGPYGQFRFDAKENKKVLLLAGGTGLSPMLSILRQIKQLDLDNDVVMIYSVRFPNEILGKAEIEALAKEIRLQLVITVSRPAQGDGWIGETGHIDQNMVTKYTPDIAERTCYICGPLEFAKAMKCILEAIGQDESRIKADIWG